MQVAPMKDFNAQEANPIDVKNDTNDLGKEEQKSRFIHLRAKGYSYAKIAKELKVSTSTLSNWNKELLKEIARAKVVELEALQEEYFMLKEGWIKLLGGQLKIIQEEINGRELSKVSTEKLMELQLRYFGELKAEYVATSMVDKTGIKLDSEEIAEQLQLVLERYKTGKIDESQAKLEQALLQSMLKAIEQPELVAKLERLESILRSRRYYMARKLTKEAIKRLLNKGLTGWERWRFLIQDFADRYFEKPPFLTDADLLEINRGLSGDKNVRDYNDLMAMGRGIEKGLMVCCMTWPVVYLDLYTLFEMLDVVEKKKTIDFFESCKPCIVTVKQYQDIVAAQREKKLKFEYCLGYVIEERFYAIAPAGAREEIDEICPDIESAKDFVFDVPEKYKDLCKQATDKIRRLYISSKLPAVFNKKDANKAEPLVAEWKSNKLSVQDTMKLVDMLFVTGQQLYQCDKLPEWKDYIDKYTKYLFGVEDERFNNSYAVLEDCPKCWTDDQGYYEYPFSTGEWVTRAKEIIWGLRAIDGEKTRSLQTVSQMLLKILDRVQWNIRMFLAFKIVIDTACEAIDVSFSEGAGVMGGVLMWVKSYIWEYNGCLRSLSEDHRWGNSEETKLEKVLKTLNPIDIEKLKPSAEFIERLKNDITANKVRYEWVQEKVHSLEYDDGITFTELLLKD